MLSRRNVLLASAALLGSLPLAEVMTPRELMARSVEQLDLGAMLPDSFATWRANPEIGLVKPTEPGTLTAELYTQVVARGYEDPQGHAVMLLLAYGPSQSDRLQLHRPEVCYTALGFRVSRIAKAGLAIGDDRALPVRRLVAERERRLEPVTYWMRVGDDVVTGILDRQLTKLRYGVLGKIPDGLLVRVSTVGIAEDTAFDLHAAFVRDLLAAIEPRHRAVLIGEHARASIAAGSAARPG